MNLLFCLRPSRLTRKKHTDTSHAEKNAKIHYDYCCVCMIGYQSMVGVFIGVDFTHLTKYADMYYLQYVSGLGTSNLSDDCYVYLPTQKRSFVVLQCDNVVQRHVFSKQGYYSFIACYTRLLACVIENSTMCMWEVSQSYYRA